MYPDEVLEERDGLRVVLVYDDDSGGPYNDGSTPLYRIIPGPWRAEQITSATSYVTPAELDRAVQLWANDLDMLKRFLRIFHGTTSFEAWDSRGNGGGDYVYVTFDTAHWREAMGLTEPGAVIADMNEWRCWVEGEVYGYQVEASVDWNRADGQPGEMATWEEVTACYGFYGLDYAQQEARAAFEAELATRKGGA